MNILTNMKGEINKTVLSIEKHLFFTHFNSFTQQKQQKFKRLIQSFLIVLALTSCDDESIFEASLETNNLTTTLFARPSNSLSLGKIIATTNVDDVRFNILEESFAGAFKIDQTSGEVFVNDSIQFDINKIDLLEAEVEVLAGDLIEISTITVILRLPEITIDYFKEIALGFENGNSSEITRKWGSTMKVFLDGNPSSAHQSKVTRTIREINNLATDGFSIQVVGNLQQSNCYMFFGTASEFLTIFPSAAIGSNWGFVSVIWNDNVIDRSIIFVDTDQPTETQQTSLILEELTQALGLGKDSPSYPGSIFYETSTDGGFATEYAEIDKELIRLLYHPEMEIGLDRDQVDASLRNILKSEW